MTMSTVWLCAFQSEGLPRCWCACKRGGLHRLQYRWTLLVPVDALQEDVQPASSSPASSSSLQEGVQPGEVVAIVIILKLLRGRRPGVKGLV